MQEFAVIIPAIKKNVAFPDDLVKRLHGITLIQRAIDKAKELTSEDNIYVVTDSDEIRLICQRNGIKLFYKKDMYLNDQNIIHELRYFLLRIHKKYSNLIFVFAYTPGVNSATIKDGYQKFLRNDGELLVSVKEENHRIFRSDNSDLIELIMLSNDNKLLVEVKSFLIIKSNIINNINNKTNIIKYILDESTVEIKSYQDWWICEKLFQRKRIVFRVIGYPEVGMGHIYRSMALAHEITDHEILFVCDERSRLAVNQIAGMDYHVAVHPAQVLEEKILQIRPNLVINDILNTSADYILRLKGSGCKVVNFEDLGSGAVLADLTINELFDEPVIPGGNIRWGHQFFFLRDEFIDASPRIFHDPVETILLTFGGTDTANLTMQSLDSVSDICREMGVSIYVVTGAGYAYKNELAAYINRLGYGKVKFTFATGVMSGIMEQTDVAICSNGRTIYELAHMNIPSIVIAHHEREATHGLASEENGFINLGVYQSSTFPELLRHHLGKLLTERDFRKKLYGRTKRFNFLKNKPKVLSLIEELLSSDQGPYGRPSDIM